MLGALATGPTWVAYADGASGGVAAPPTTPSSEGFAHVDNGQLQAGAGGTYEPVTPDTLPASAVDPRDPRTVPPGGVDPQGEQCPSPNTETFHVLSGQVLPGQPAGSIIRAFLIYPSFIANKTGGYDGLDAEFGYKVADAIPSGGNPTQTQLDAPATAANIAGHVIAVPAFIQSYGHWQEARPAPPYGGSCVGATFGFGAPFIAGDSPPPPPTQDVLAAPPFALGKALLAEVTGFWRIGSLQTLPGPAATSRTYVHIPTCAWLDSNVPTVPTQLHAIKTTVSNGFTLFLVYNVTLTPGPVTWDWGDGTRTTSSGAAEAPPSTLPSYDPTSQIWTDPCGVSHSYASVSSGRTITATEAFTATITVSWSDGVAVHTEPVACDPATLGACSLVIGTPQGWVSGPHPVDQIESVPYSPHRN